ncbi:hypothetical protein [Moorena bouillonii]|uniref:hypothetical protein n=1 Tax=Moorena bouillonii TaxID=207920 RepID=UPI00117BED9F|nr:hypothetical protein [Moorena bouillonii]
MQRIAIPYSLFPIPCSRLDAVAHGVSPMSDCIKTTGKHSFNSHEIHRLLACATKLISFYPDFDSH